MSSSHDKQVGKRKFLLSNSAPGRDGTLCSQQFFFLIHTGFLAHFAIGLLSDTHFSNSHSASYTSSFSTDASKLRSHQLNVTDTLMHWVEVSRKREVVFFLWLAEKSPRPHIQSTIKVFHSFLPDISHICFFLSTPTDITVVQDSTGSCLGGCCNSLPLLFLHLASSLRSPRKTEAAFSLFSSLLCSKASKGSSLRKQWNPI